MTRHPHNFGWLSAIGVLCGLAVHVAPVRAQDSSVLVEQPADAATQGPALSTPENGRPLPPPERPSGVQPNGTSRRPFMRPAEPEPYVVEQPLTAEPIPAPPSVMSEVQVRSAPPIKYDTDHRVRRMYARYGTADIVMLTENPADGCVYEIPLCVPACCAAEEVRVSSRRGIFGRGVVEYCWPCGFTAEIKFRHILGDVKVDYDA